MKIIDENGRYHTISLSKYYGLKRENCSALHEQLRDFLLKIFPNTQILEEVYIDSWKVYFDFYLPLHKLACEADGKQHDEYVPFFHKNKMKYAAAKGRDNKKQNCCDTNHITLVRFKADESEEEWLKTLKNNLKK